MLSFVREKKRAGAAIISNASIRRHARGAQGGTSGQFNRAASAAARHNIKNKKKRESLKGVSMSTCTFMNPHTERILFSGGHTST